LADRTALHCCQQDEWVPAAASAYWTVECLWRWGTESLAARATQPHSRLLPCWKLGRIVRLSAVPYRLTSAVAVVVLQMDWRVRSSMTELL